MNTKARGVIIRSNNVGSNYRVPKPFSKTNRSFNSIANYSFARKSLVNRSLRSSNSYSFKSIMKDMNKKGISMEKNNIKRYVRRTKNGNRISFLRMLNPMLTLNRKNGNIHSQQFVNYLQQNMTISNKQDFTYQNRLDESYNQMGANATRRKLK